MTEVDILIKLKMEDMLLLCLERCRYFQIIIKCKYENNDWTKRADVDA